MQKKALQKKVKIIANAKVGEAYFCLSLRSPEVARLAEAGQFVQVRVSDGDQPLLRRPFGVHRVHGPDFDLLYEVVGPATKILSQRKSGEYLDIIGPLGNGFNCQLLTVNRQLFLVAGGMGVATLLFLAEKLKKYSPQVLIGARSKVGILCEKEFQKLGCSVKIATDDGSQGFHGKVTDLLLKELSTIDHRPATIYACGPRPMLKEIARISRASGVPAAISLEEHLSCGIGACLGCVVETKTGFQRVCKDGPVFDAEEIIW